MKTSWLIGAGLAAGLIGVAASAQPGARPDGQVRKFVRFQAGDVEAYGLLEGERVRRISGDLFGKWNLSQETHELSRVKLLVPCRPSKVLALARNYQSHLGQVSPPKNPEFFFKPPSCLVADGEPIIIPPGTHDVHYEAEMVIVIGKRAKDVPVERAGEYVLGVTCGNDVSARDWQKGDIQWWRAKGADTFGPCGPVIVSGLDYDNLPMQLRLNGKVELTTNTNEMIFDVAAAVSFASRHVTLEPGDLIYTGTAGQTSAIKPGDVVEVEIEGVGVLRNPVKAAAR